MQFLSRKHFELLKGIGIIAILVSHIGGYSGLTWFTPLGGIGVALFLFCSGYGLCCSYTDAGLKNFWKKRIIGVYFPYFLIELVTAFIFTRSIKTVILDLLLIKPDYCYGWYMQYIFGCYLVFWIVFKFIKQEKTRMIILIGLAIFSFFVFDSLRGEQAFSFVGGILTAIIANKKSFDFKYAKALSVLVLFLSVALLAIKQLPIIRQQNEYILTLLNLLIKTFAAASIIYLTYAIKFINKIGKVIFPFFAKMSYVLYLVHGYLIFIISNNLLGNYLINSIVFLIVSITVAYIVNFAIKKCTNGLYKILQVK